MNLQRSKELFDKSQKCIPGGVNSPVRSFKGMEISPPFIKSAEGCYIIDEDNNTYIDYVLSWGPMILGHGDKDVKDAIGKQLNLGTSFGAPTLLELQLAQEILDIYESMDMIRMVCSGTEATMSAIRLARGYSKKEKIIKFNGCYHGHGDCLLVEAGSGALTHGEPNSPGVLADIAKHTLVAEYNDISSVEALFKENPDNIAGIIVEPIPGNMGVLLPQNDFLKNLRSLCDKYNSLLIFDEVMSGFRASFNGAEKLFGVEPDLITLGKVIGGGLPVGAYGGKRDIMKEISPIGPVYQAGTLSGNPLAMTAGLTTLNKLKSLNPYQDLSNSVKEMAKDIKKTNSKFGKNYCFNHIGSMFTLFFYEGEVTKKSDVDKCDFTLFSKYFTFMMERGIYIAPSQYEAGFVSVCHTSQDLEKTAKSYYDFLQQV
ncbi:MAG: glutamate-1-semialdehyde-2,1-aminomutase [Candidatus Cloacimonadota bacterium]|nr:MAG: glutamate-1-semialdehyde-2,1-aminomutase [Candidatus Cloacimonadota bacterium]